MQKFESTIIDCWKEAAAQGPERLRAKRSSSSRNDILLIGVDSFIGRKIGSSIFKKIYQATSWKYLSFKKFPKLYCISPLCPPDDPAKHIFRVMDCCKDYDTEMVDSGLIEMIYGNPTEASFGLSSDKYSELAANVSRVFFADHPVDLFCSFDSVCKDLSSKVCNTIKICVERRMKELFYISSVFGLPEAHNFIKNHQNKFRKMDWRIVEDDNLKLNSERKRIIESIAGPSEAGSGIPISSCALESAFQEIRNFGLPITLFRLPYLWSSSQEMGYANPEGFFPEFMRMIYTTEKVPQFLPFLSTTPVDIVSQLIVDTGFFDNRMYWTYNISNNEIYTGQQIFYWLYMAGIQTEIVAPSLWLEGACQHSPKFDSLKSYFKTFSWFEDMPPFNPMLSIPMNQLTDELGLLTDEYSRAFRWPDSRDVFVNSLTRLNFEKHLFDTNLPVCHPYMTIEHVIQRARDETGLHDLGDLEETMLEGGTVLLNALRNSTNVVFALRAGLIRMFTHFVKSILYIVEQEKRHPEILQESIKAPIFILGLNRTGSTLLFHLLGCDPNLRCPTLTEMMYPYGGNGEFCPRRKPASCNLENDPRNIRTRELMNSLICLDTEFMQLHMMRSVQPEEDLHPFDMIFRGFMAIVGFDVPDYKDWLMQNDWERIKPGYAFHARLIKHLQMQSTATQWIFKMPFHCLGLEELIKTYPDAKFILCHRDPTAVMKSWCHLEGVIRDTTCFSSNEPAVGQAALGLLSSMGTKLTEFVKANPNLEGRIFHCYFDRLVADPFRSLREIYSFFNIPFTSLASRRMFEYSMKNRKNRKHLKTSYDLQKAHLSPRQINEKFLYYTKHFIEGKAIIIKHTLYERIATILSGLDFLKNKFLF
eukprot:GHVP01009326.1.p1 GENE.GHVP01009326.1~~GHVP01009326.1.p1  ORF type:complete len:873 (-),score=108.98 GHVP01009326.1:958-3576(-)